MNSFMNYISTFNKKRTLKVVSILSIIVIILYICIQICVYIISYGITTFSSITDTNTSIGVQAVVLPVLISVASVVLYPIIYIYNYVRPYINMVFDSIIQILLRKYFYIYESTDNRINIERNNMIMQNITKTTPYAGKYYLTEDKIKYPIGLIYDTNLSWFAYISVKIDYDDPLYSISLYAYSETDVTDLISNNMCNNVYNKPNTKSKSKYIDLDDDDTYDIVEYTGSNEYLELCKTSSYLHSPLKPIKFLYNMVNTDEQNTVINNIIKLVEARHKNIGAYNGSILLHGVPGTGKSAIGTILAYKLKGVVCTDYSPFRPGTRIERMIKACNPTKDNPLIILINELYEQIYYHIHNENILSNQSSSNMDLTPEIYNKTTFNNWMDNLSKFNHVIFIFTSNVGIEKYNELDTSYMRRGRIHKVFELTNSNIINNILDSQEYVNELNPELEIETKKSN
jgi:hypothetical protein